ncbi:MAG: DUF3347 domain-containing protein [Balneolaceae bacterium]
MKTSITLLFSLLLTVVATAQHEGHHQHKSHLDTLVAEYLEVKNALVEDDLETAKKHLEIFAEEVKGSGEMNQHEEHAEDHKAHHSAMLAAVGAASEAENIEEFRTAFRDVSEELIKAVENQGYDEKLFVQFCSMKEGGYWLSKEEKIQNPFFGSAMPTCGSVDKTIE